MRECLALVDEGVIDVEGLDLCVKWGIGYKLAVIPPIQLLDMAGLDIYTSVASFLNADLSNETGISKTATDLRDEGRLGIKTGRGFFEYTPERIKELQQQRGAALVAVRKALELTMAKRNESAPARLRHAGHRPVAHHLEHRLRDPGPLPGLQRPDRASRRALHVRLAATTSTWSTTCCRSSCPSRRPSRRSPRSSPSAASSPRTSTR